jgi:hypothetical protein
MGDRPRIVRDAPRSTPGRSGGLPVDAHDEDYEDYGAHMAQFEESADRAMGRRIPYGDVARPWQPEPMMAPRRRYVPHRYEEDQPKEVLGDVSRQALQIFVGDLAPQVEGALNFVANNEMAKSAVAFAGLGLTALVLPRLMK